MVRPEIRRGGRTPDLLILGLSLASLHRGAPESRYPHSIFRGIYLTPPDKTGCGLTSLGNLGALADAQSHITQNLFGPFREMIGKTLPDGMLTETRKYDNNGNLASLTHVNGVTTRGAER